jgi:hypothetical protein
VEKAAANAKPAQNTVASLFSRREQLVKIALEDRTFFSRAIVNRLWAYFMGQGLVHPVDQMHSANPPAIPGLLEWLADDLATHGYDLDRVVAGLVSSHVYELASIGSDEAGERQFARAQLRPLTPQQYAFSVALATGDGMFDQVSKPEEQVKRHRELEGQIAPLIKLQLLDQRSDRFQSSTGEALFMSNHAAIQQMVMPAGKNLAARLVTQGDTKQLVAEAIWTVLSRPPEEDEVAFLARWFDEHKQERAKACGELIWALTTSAEFRFIH